MPPFKALLSLLALLPVLCLRAQSPANDVLPGGGGEYPFPRQYETCLSEADRLLIREEIDRNRTGGQRSAVAVSLEWPLAASPALPWPNYYGISGFVDHDATSGYENYFCNDRTYDGHKGTDYFTWPFPHYLQENDLVQVVAAAPGTVISRRDGNADDNCAWGSQSWNAVYVEHTDGSVAWYGHLKRNSVTSKQVGDRVAAGEYLGVVGSSGRSSGPHLHLELYDAGGDLIDPYVGDCNATTGSSWWAEQEPHRETTINAVLTHSAVPEHGCPASNERPSISNEFALGQRVYLGLYLKDQAAGSSARLRLIDPTGAEVERWNNDFSVNYNASWWWWSRLLGTSARQGMWTFEVTINGQTESHQFQYGDVVSGVLAAEVAEATTLSPNPVGSLLRIDSPVGFESAEVIDATGRVLLVSEVGAGQTIDLRGAGRGILMIRLSSERGVLVRRVVRR